MVVIRVALFAALLALKPPLPWIIAAAVILFFPVVLHFALRREYVVHKNGAILVTGASSGVGLAITEALASRGFCVFAGVRKESQGGMLREKNGTIKPVILDVTKASDIKAAKGQIENYLAKEKLPFVAVINCAGDAPHSLWECVDAETVKQIYDINVFGTIAIFQNFLPILRAHRGRIINCSSAAAYVSPPGSGLYASTKAAISSISDSLRREVMDLGVSVSVLEFAFAKTPLLDKQKSPIVGECGDIYAHLAEGAADRRKDVEKSAQSVEAVVEISLEALLSPFPLARYRSGNVAGRPLKVMLFLLKVFPDELKDKIIKSVF